MKKFALLVTLFSVAIAFGQKKKIDYTIYDSWKTIATHHISDNGLQTCYEVKPQQGNSKVIVKSLKGNHETLLEIDRATNPKFVGENYLACVIKPDFDSLRKLKLAETKKDKLPKNNLLIINFHSSDTVYFGEYKDYQISEKGSTVAWLTEKVDDSCPNKCNNKCKECKKKAKKKKRKKGEPVIKKLGGTLSFTNVNDGTQLIEKVNYVDEFLLSNYDQKIAFISKKQVDKKDSVSLTCINLNDKTKINIANGQTSIKKLTFSEKASFLAFLHSADTSKVKVHDLSMWNAGKPSLVRITNKSEMDTLHSVSENRRISFSANEARLFYGIGSRPKEEPKDTLLKNEKAVLDVWSWTDKQLQPQQLKKLKNAKNKSNLHVYHIAENKAIQLEDDTLRWSYGLNKSQNQFGVLTNKNPYEHTYSWEMPWKEDVYLIDINNGNKFLAKEQVKHDLRISNSGRYAVWFNSNDSNFYATNLIDKKDVCLTNNIGDVLAADNNGMPFEPYSRGVYGFDKNEGFVYFQGKFDVWKSNLKTGENSRITHGRKDSIRYNLTFLNRDSSFLYWPNIMITSHNYKTHDEALYKFDGANIEKVFGGAYNFYGVQKAKNADELLVRFGNTKVYPDLSVVRNGAIEQVSQANTQQSEFNWASVESFFWTTPKGHRLEGLVYKPEDFDPNKKYPLMVYFYELYSESKHNHYTPRPSASIINPLEYASNGYVVFIPDIRYQPGHPATSAYDCIVSGTDSLAATYSWINTDKMALQGQSWGGYQTAQLVTMTDKYACAMAGAPVSNMFSAYGGIRWGSGLSRMFQYERTQSRIGATIWEKPELYKENSPIFALPKVNTPLLIMHNDGDGAVPWYQGIEMFVGLRRLGKPVWMLNYNGDEHNLMKRANRMDLSRRMRGFFDHYLLDRPAPKWLVNGVPAIDKGKDPGFELISE